VTNFLPRDSAGWATLVVAFLVVALLAVCFFRFVAFPQWPADASIEGLVWERDRVQALAKGTATSASGFLTALVVALLDKDVNSNVPGIAVLGCLLGAVGLLIGAAQMSMKVRLPK
jgi:hypothetical protein